VPDYLRDWRDITQLAQNGSRLRKQRFLDKIDRFEFELKRVGGKLGNQADFVRVLCEDKPRDFPEMMSKFCMVRLLRNDYSDWTGWEYRNEWAISTYAQGLKRWRLEEVKSLAVLGEQGIGDELMFISVLPEVLRRVPRVVVECDPRLITVISRSFGVECRPRQDLTAVREEEAFIPVGDLPRLFRKKVGDFPRTPYISPLPEMVQKWSHLKGRTGIAWRSRTASYKPEDFRIANPVCLQYDAWPSETKGMTVPECDLKDDIEDLLGICANLERVVSVPQTITHIAGSIGTHVDVVMAPVGSGRVENVIPYRYGDPMVWYQNVKVHPSLNAYRNRRSWP
jgi:hypothetical protein